jgi:hypothetical protein
MLLSLPEAAMKRNRSLLLLAFVGSAVCWWPAIIELSLDFPRWILLAPVAFISGTSTLLSRAAGDGEHSLLLLRLEALRAL